jgi:hypothetical protein
MTSKALGHVSATVAASIMGVTRQRMHQLLKEGRIKGAFLLDIGNGRTRWVVPREELKPRKMKHEHQQTAN